MEININELINEINKYNLSLHKLTYRYGIDYIKYNQDFKEKYPEVIKELSNYYIPRRVMMKQYTSIDNDTIECGNQYEMETMVGIPKSNRVINDGIEYIEDLRWELLSECNEEEIKGYQDKLSLKFNVFGEYINNMSKTKTNEELNIKLIELIATYRELNHELYNPKKTDDFIIHHKTILDKLENQLTLIKLMVWVLGCDEEQIPLLNDTTRNEYVNEMGVKDKIK